VVKSCGRDEEAARFASRDHRGGYPRMSYRRATH